MTTANTGIHFPNRMFVDGNDVDSIKRYRIPCFDPSTGESVVGVPRADADDVDYAVKCADRAFCQVWSGTSPNDRAGILFAFAAKLEEHRQELAFLDTMTMGKPLNRSLEEVTEAAEVIRYNAGAADKMEGRSIPISRNFLDYTELVPIGPTGHIVPWNFPLGMAIRSVAPALAAGCTVVLKPAEQTPLSAIRIAQIAVDAGLPPGVFNVITGTGEEAGSTLVAHPLIRGVSFTGSLDTGRSVMRQAAGRVTPLVLELGGKNPAIVFPDADLERTAEEIVTAAFDNTGQICAAASRLILHRSIAEPFIELLNGRVNSLTIGPGSTSPNLGPLAHAAHYEKVKGYIERAEKTHQSLRSDTSRALPEAGCFVGPELYEISDFSSELWRDEVFGPVLAVIYFETEEEAIHLANDTEYGLCAGVFTSDISRAIRISREIEVGSFWINGWFLGGIQAPTGGTKQSGFGKERGLPGLEHFTNIRNTVVKLIHDDCATSQGD